MTAEEYLNDQHVYFEALKDKGVLRVVHSIMNEYANLKKSEWCKEQREICAEKYKTLTYDSTSVWAMTVIAIRNAPEPKGETE